MKVTKARLKEIIQEELNRLQQEEEQVDEGFGDTAKQLRSKGAALANKLSAAKSLEPFWSKLASGDKTDKAQFLAMIANKLGIQIKDVTALASTQQTKLAGSAPSADAPTEAPPEEPVVENHRHPRRGRRSRQ